MAVDNHHKPFGRRPIVALSSAQARQLRELAFSSEAPSNGFQSVVDGFYDSRDSFCNVGFGTHRGLKADSVDPGHPTGNVSALTPNRLTVRVATPTARGNKTGELCP